MRGYTAAAAAAAAAFGDFDRRYVPSFTDIKRVVVVVVVVQASKLGMFTVKYHYLFYGMVSETGRRKKKF